MIDRSVTLLSHFSRACQAIGGVPIIGTMALRDTRQGSLTVALLLAACGGGGGESGIDAGNVSYAEDVAPIFSGSCMFCHHEGGAAPGDMENTFDPETGLINQPNTWVEAHGSDETVLVDPGNVDNSFILVKVQEDLHVPEEDGSLMPLHLPRFTEDELATVEQWIADGAQNDAFFDENVKPLFGDDITLGRRAGRCTYCHYPGTPNGMSVLDVFDPETGMVGVESVYGGLIVAPGDPDASVLMKKLRGEPGVGAQMPFHPTPLTEHQVDVIASWIAGGALDN